jgi:hypothetical protein
MGALNDSKSPSECGWPVLVRQSHMDREQAAFYQAMWYVAGLAWVCGVADEALKAVCEVTLRAAGRLDG